MNGNNFNPMGVPKNSYAGYGQAYAPQNNFNSQMQNFQQMVQQQPQYQQQYQPAIQQPMQPQPQPQYVPTQPIYQPIQPQVQQPQENTQPQEEQLNKGHYMRLKGDINKAYEMIEGLANKLVEIDNKLTQILNNTSGNSSEVKV